MRFRVLRREGSESSGGVGDAAASGVDGERALVGAPAAAALDVAENRRLLAEPLDVLGGEGEGNPAVVVPVFLPFLIVGHPAVRLRLHEDAFGRQDLSVERRLPRAQLLVPLAELFGIFDAHPGSGDRRPPRARTVSLEVLASK